MLSLPVFIDITAKYTLRNIRITKEISNKLNTE